MISRNTRPYRAGRELGNGLCEVGNILYLKDNREQFLLGVKERLDSELEEMEGLSQELTGGRDGQKGS